MEISGEIIYKLTGLSNKGDLVPMGIKYGLVERLTGTLTGKNSKGLIVGQIQATTPKNGGQNHVYSLNVMGRGFDFSNYHSFGILSCRCSC